MKRIFCPECNHSLTVSRHLHQKQEFICPQCAASFRVSKTHPAELESVAHLTDYQPKLLPQETACPNCRHLIRFRTRLQEGQMVTCNRCHAELEVVNLTPLEFEPVVSSSRQLKRNQRRSKEARQSFEQQPFYQSRSGKEGGAKQQKYRRNDVGDDD